MDGGLHFAAIGRIASACRGVINAVDFNHVPVIILHYVSAPDEISPPKTHLPSRRKPEILLWRIFAKIVLLDKNLAGERDLPGTRGRVFGIIHRPHLFGLTFGVVVDN